jgi:hypothetical protein
MVIKKNTLKKKSFNNKSLKKKNVTKKSTTTVNVAELTKKLKENQDKGPVDEKGNPYPIENPDGGDPICPGGYKIDYQFDIFDPINPPFRCISSLKEDGDGGIANKMLEMANNPSSGLDDIMTGNDKIIGGKKITRRFRGHRRRRRRSRTRSRSRSS